MRTSDIADIYPNHSNSPPLSEPARAGIYPTCSKPGRKQQERTSCSRYLAADITHYASARYYPEFSHLSALPSAASLVAEDSSCSWLKPVLSWFTHASVACRVPQNLWLHANCLLHVRVGGPGWHAPVASFICTAQRRFCTLDAAVFLVLRRHTTVAYCVRSCLIAERWANDGSQLKGRLDPRHPAAGGSGQVRSQPAQTMISSRPSGSLTRD